VEFCWQSFDPVHMVLLLPSKWSLQPVLNILQWLQVTNCAVFCEVSDWWE
jgi:hypothetical protein